MNEEMKPVEAPATNIASPLAKPRKLIAWLPVLILCGAFLVGFVPMWLKSSRLSAELFRVERQARVLQIQITFADAALDARHGDYEPARQGMANFFSLVNTETDRGIGSALPTGTTENLKPILAQRDDLITLLARGDPASAERLAIAYTGFRKSLGK